MGKINIQVINGKVFTTPELSPVDRFLKCIKELEDERNDGTLFDYSERLMGIAESYYPYHSGPLPRLVNGRIVCLIREEEKKRVLREAAQLVFNFLGK